ncbi:MAG: hypothetical protein ACLQKH_13755 [Steroidobacteraceae bacterium]
MSAEPASIMFAAKRTVQFQMPPLERPGPDELLLLRVPAVEEGQDTWRLPKIGEFEHPGQLLPWVEGVHLARLDQRFTPDVPGRDYFWCVWTLARSISPTAYHPAVLPALEKFGQEKTLDDILARVDARADSDSSVGDSAMSTTIQDLQRQVAALQRQVGAPIEGRDKFIAAQSRAEPVYRAFGDTAPPFMGSERLRDYTIRLLTPHLKHSKRWRDKSLEGTTNDAVLTVIEAEVYADAMSEATHPTSFRPGQIRPVSQPDASGRPITRYVGDQNACWDQFNPPFRYVRRFNTAGRA